VKAEYLPFHGAGGSIVKHMAHLAKSAASLRIIGDDLNPEEITSLLGCEPTQGQRKGEAIIGKKIGSVRVARTGLWRLGVADSDPAEIDAQIGEILGRLSSDLKVWRDLASRFEMDLFCGLFMDCSNEGIEISAESLLALGERGIKIGLDIYGGCDGEE
jgi:hypothetical protein